jgi:hypothetical protein
MSYVLPPAITLLVLFGAFAWQFGLVSAGKWLGLVAVAEILSFIPLMGLPGMLAMLIGTPWTILFFGNHDAVANSGPEIWGAAMGMSLWIPLAVFPAEWILRTWFPQMEGLSRWGLFALFVAIWSSFAPVVFYLQDPGYAAALRGENLNTPRNP